MIRRCRVWRTSMMALHSRLTTIIFVLACALCAPGSIKARAQEVTTASENGGKWPTPGAPFVDPLNAPHWKGWGGDSSPHPFPPSVIYCSARVVGGGGCLPGEVEGFG